MIIAKAYDEYVRALNDGLNHKEALKEAVFLWSHAGVTVKNLSAFIASQPTLQEFAMLNVDLYTESAKLALEHEYTYSFAVGSVIRSKKTGLLWSVIGLHFSCVQITKRDGILYAPKLKATCQDGTTTDMYDQLMAGNFEIVDLNATQCDRKTFKGLRNLIGLHCVVIGVLANKAHKCYQFKAAPHNLIKPLLCTSIKTGKLMLDDTFKIDHKNRTALIFGRVTPLFNFKGRKA